MSPHLFDLDARDVATTNDDWYTPQWVFDAVGLTFDMDVAAPVDPTLNKAPAVRYLSVLDDGLSTPWRGRIWCNPPYSNSAAWVDKWADHHAGLILVPAVKATWLGTLLAAADALTVLRVDFDRPNGESGELRWPVFMAARGRDMVDALTRVAASDKCARGAYLVRPTDAARSRVPADTDTGRGQ